MSTNTGNKKPRANAGKKTKTGNKMSTKSKSKTKTTKKRGKGSNAKSKSKTKSRSKTGRRTRTSKTNEKKNQGSKVQPNLDVYKMGQLMSQPQQQTPQQLLPTRPILLKKDARHLEKGVDKYFPQ